MNTRKLLLALSTIFLVGSLSAKGGAYCTKCGKKNEQQEDRQTSRKKNSNRDIRSGSGNNREKRSARRNTK